MINANDALKRVLEDLLSGVIRASQEVVTRLKELKKTPGVRPIEIKHIDNLIGMHDVFGLVPSDPVSGNLQANVWIELIEKAIESMGEDGNEGAPPPASPPPGPSM